VRAGGGAGEDVTSDHVLLIDDSSQILRVLGVALTARGYRAETAATGQAGLAAASRCPPDLVVVDLTLPDMTGFEVIRSLRRWSRAPIIVLSGSTDVADKVRALDAGADDYVSKPFDIPELIARMRAASRRANRGAGGGAGASRVRVGPWTVDIAGHSVSGPQGAVSLTPTEWTLLETLARQPGRLVTQDELVAEMPSRPHVADSSYLRAHIMNLRQKLEPDPARPRYLVTEPGMGYRLRP
jgi:two-component system KDP operon response regulator KdpE